MTDPDATTPPWLKGVGCLPLDLATLPFILPATGSNYGFANLSLDSLGQLLKGQPSLKFDLTVSGSCSIDHSTVGVTTEHVGSGSTAHTYTDTVNINESGSASFTLLYHLEFTIPLHPNLALTDISHATLGGGFNLTATVTADAANLDNGGNYSFSLHEHSTNPSESTDTDYAYNLVLGTTSNPNPAAALGVARFSNRQPCLSFSMNVETLLTPIGGDIGKISQPDFGVQVYLGTGQLPSAPDYPNIIGSGNVTMFGATIPWVALGDSRDYSKNPVDPEPQPGDPGYDPNFSETESGSLVNAVSSVTLAMTS